MKYRLRYTPYTDRWDVQAAGDDGIYSTLPTLGEYLTKTEAENAAKWHALRLKKLYMSPTFVDLGEL